MISKTFLWCYLILLTTFSLSYGASAETVSIRSQKMDTSLRAMIMFTDNYGEGDMPGVYLLHVWNCSYQDWYDKTEINPVSSGFSQLIESPQELLLPYKLLSLPPSHKLLSNF